MGVHEVHYAMIAILAMGIGLFAPPFGIGYYGVVRDRAGVAGRRAVADLALPRGTDGRPGVVVAAVPWMSIGFL